MNILIEVAKINGLSVKQLLSKNRTRKYVLARKDAAKRFRSVGLSYPAIGRILKRDHTTIIRCMDGLVKKQRCMSSNGKKELLIKKQKKRTLLRHKREAMRAIRRASYREELQRKKEYRFTMYRNSARTRGLTFSLTFDKFCEFWQKPCSYCGDPIETIGIDRVDSGRGYVLGNLTPCCTLCNSIKNVLSKERFLAHCTKIVNNHEPNLPCAEVPMDR